MSDEKPKKPRASTTGGDRPMRRRTAPVVKTRESAGGEERAPRKQPFGKPRFDRPASGKASFGKTDGGKPEFKKPAFKKPPYQKASAPPVSAPTPAPAKAFEGERIAKVMARAGVCSRRDAEGWIADGRVAVNGGTLRSPAVNVREGDRITIDGQPMRERERTRLFLFHKPAGLVTSAHDPEGRETVFAYLDARHPDLPRLVSVGRLDINTEGLLLLTNDGGLARTLELPATGWTRRYRVRVHGETDQARLDELKKGVTVDGVTYAPIDAALDRTQGSNAWISMTLTEGKNREIKRVLEHLMLDVTRLIRVSFGPFQLGDLADGAVEEVKLKVLREQLGKGLAELAGVDFSSPLREEPSAAQAQEARERVQKRSRKHVSVLRGQREETRDKGPRARIERGATADRKGRAVAVERVVATRPKAPVQTRNARRFEALRRDGEEGARAGAARPPRAEGASRYERSDARPPRGRAPRAEGGFERKDRRERPDNKEARAPRGDRAPRERSFERGEARAGASRPPRGEGGSRFERSDARPPRGRAPRAEGGYERKERADVKDARAPRGERAPRERNFERDGKRGGERSPPPGGKPRAQGAARKFDGPRSEGARKPGGPRKPGGAGKPGGFGKPGGRGPVSRGPAGRGPGGPRKPRGPK